MQRQGSPALKVFIFVAVLFSCSANAESSNYVDRAGQDPDQKCNHPSDTAPPFNIIYEKHTNAIFGVWVTNASGPERAGTATLIDDSGVFLTAAHVVKDHVKNKITLRQYQNGNKWEYDAEVVTGSETSDAHHDNVLLRAKNWQNNHRVPYQLRFDDVDREKIYLQGFEDKNTVEENNDMPVRIHIEFRSIDQNTHSVQYKGTVFGNASGALIYDQFGRAFEIVFGHKVSHIETFKDTAPERYREDSATRDTMLAFQLQDTLDMLKACLGPTPYMRTLIGELQSDINTTLLSDLMLNATAVDIALLIDEEFFGEVGAKWTPHVEENDTLIQKIENAAENLCVRKYFFRVMAQAWDKNVNGTTNAGLGSCVAAADRQSETSSSPANNPPPPDGAGLARRLGARTPEAIGKYGASFLEQALTTSFNQPGLNRAYIEMALRLLRHGANSPVLLRARETRKYEREYAALEGNLALAEELGVKYGIGSREAASDAIFAADALGGSPTAYQLAAQYAMEEQDFDAAAGLYARAYAALSEGNPRNGALRSLLTADFTKLAAYAPVFAEASIQNFRVSPSAPPNASRWYALAAADVGASPADLREKSQMASLRMRTLNWYDVKWSKTNVTVNEEYEITGKIHVMNAWPAAISVPDKVSLSVGPSDVGKLGPVATSVGVFIGGELTPRPVKLELGKTYEFRIVQRARRPGHWHTQVQLSVMTGGPIPGPGQFIDVKGNFAEFTDPAKLHWPTVDIENFGIGKIYLWHIFLPLTGVAWIVYWFGKRGLVSRFVAAASGKAEELITPQERLMGAVSLAAVLGGGVIIFYAITVSNYPNTIPLQAGEVQALQNEVDSGPITIKYVNGTYKVPGRELVANFKITNNGKEPLRLGELNTAGLRFLNPDVSNSKVEYPDYLLADRGLSLSDNSPIAPGETRDIAVTIQDARWDTERLSGLAYDVDSSFAGVLFFYAPSGARYPMEVGGAVIPTFMPI